MHLDHSAVDQRPVLSSKWFRLAFRVTTSSSETVRESNTLHENSDRDVGEHHQEEHFALAILHQIAEHV